MSEPPLIDASRLILIVCGSTLGAEWLDRPVAYALRDRFRAWLGAQGAGRGVADPTGRAPRVLVCSDIWYLNQDELRACPTLSVGGPAVNALTAYLGDKLPSAYVVEGVQMVQLDLEGGSAAFETVAAACWGRDAHGTAAAADAFADRYLDLFMERATEGWW